MPFIPENELERALVEAVKNPARAPDFYRLLLDSSLLVLGSAEGQENSREQFDLAPGGRLKLVPGTRDGGGHFLPVFSSLTRMQDYVKEESKYLAINGRGLLDVTRGAPVILNPASEYGKEFSAREIGQLLDGPAAVIPQYTSDEDYPPALTEALVSLFKSREDVIAAWMAKVGFSDRGGERHPLVGIELDTSADGWPSLMQAIEKTAQAHAAGVMFDILRVDRDNPVGLTTALLNAPPFYVRPAGASTLN